MWMTYLLCNGFICLWHTYFVMDLYVDEILIFCNGFICLWHTYFVMDLYVDDILIFCNGFICGWHTYFVVDIAGCEAWIVWIAGVPAQRHPEIHGAEIWPKHPRWLRPARWGTLQRGHHWVLHSQVCEDGACERHLRSTTQSDKLINGGSIGQFVKTERVKDTWGPQLRVISYTMLAPSASLWRRSVWMTLEVHNSEW